MRLSGWTWTADIDSFASTADEAIWTGVIISQDGEILTTSEALGNAPVVNIELSDGTQGQACVTGRDDNIGLALLKPLLEPRTYDFAELSSEAPLIGDRLALIHHSASSPHVSKWIVTVSGYQEGDPEYAYFGIQAGDTPADGATVMNTHAEVQGIRMPSLWLLQHEISNPGEVWAIDAQDVASIALPILRSGRMHFDYQLLGEVASWPPPSHGRVLHGELTVDGLPAPAGSTVYARLVKDGLPDYWTSDRTSEVGYYILNVYAPSNSYVGATIEFWMDCRRASATAVIGGDIFHTNPLDLAF